MQERDVESKDEEKEKLTEKLSMPMPVPVPVLVVSSNENLVYDRGLFRVVQDCYPD